MEGKFLTQRVEALEIEVQKLKLTRQQMKAKSFKRAYGNNDQRTLNYAIQNARPHEQLDILLTFYNLPGTKEKDRLTFEFATGSLSIEEFYTAVREYLASNAVEPQDTLSEDQKSVLDVCLEICLNQYTAADAYYAIKERFKL